MRIIGHGIDAVQVSEIKAALDATNKRWQAEVYSERERAEADSGPIASRYFAGRFAGKEAVVKALGCGFAGEVTWSGVEILRHASGLPYIQLNGGALEHAVNLGVVDWMVSITHCG